MKVYILKNGETFTAPSMFFNLQHPLDAKAFVKATGRGQGLPNIDGYVTDLVDHKRISEELGLNDTQLIEPSRSDARNKIKWLDPNLHRLLSGTDDEKEAMLRTGLFDARIKRPIRELSKIKNNKERGRKVIDEVYPHLTSRPLIEFELKHNTSGIIAPSVGITSNRYLIRQVHQNTKMLMDTRTLLDTSLRGYRDTRDLINVISISTHLLDPANWVTLFRMAVCNNPDQVGFRFMGYKEIDVEKIKGMFKFVRAFATYSMDVLDRTEPIPIHLFNVDELGYAGYCNAVCNIVSPVATSPYYHFVSKDDEGDNEVDNRPTLYHPQTMRQPKMETLELLPCPCRWCKDYRNRLSNIPKKDRPLFRRLHWEDCKDEEIRQFREAKQRLDFALRDKLAQSDRTSLIPFISEEPMFTIY
ncbi:MAG: hypothetical protein ACLQEQ_03690 [Nitrososphaerales archaeon]